MCVHESDFEVCKREDSKTSRVPVAIDGLSLDTYYSPLVIIPYCAMQVAGAT